MIKILLFVLVTTNAFSVSLRINKIESDESIIISLLDDNQSIKIEDCESNRCQVITDGVTIDQFKSQLSLHKETIKPTHPAVILTLTACLCK